jgi:radical SAM protein with 4Fe4S-binding SPASM domain
MNELDVNQIIDLLNTEKEKSMDNHKKKVIDSFISGIKKYGYNKPLIAPRKATWDLTSRCNLLCQHCSNKELSYGDDLSTESIITILHQLHEFGIQHISFSGGEPLLREDIFHILQRAKDLGIAVTLATNSTLIDSQTASHLHEIGIDSIQTSIDGMGTTHDTFRGVAGCFEKAVDGIKNLVKAGLTVVVTTTVTTLNCSEIEHIIDLCLEMGVHAYVINDLIPVGSGRNLLSYRLRDEQYAHYAAYFKEKRSILKGKLELLWGGVGTFPDKKQDADRVIIQTRCLACFHRFNIASDGTVQPCNLMPLEAGNILQQSIDEIWTQSPVFIALRDRDSLKGVCGTCVYRYSCGGCRARAYAIFHDFHAEDPRCLRWKK